MPVRRSRRHSDMFAVEMEASIRLDATIPKNHRDLGFRVSNCTLSIK